MSAARCSSINCLSSGINILAGGSSITLISERKGTGPHWKHLRCTHLASSRGSRDVTASLACVRLIGWPVAWNWRRAVLSADAGLLVMFRLVRDKCMWQRQIPFGMQHLFWEVNFWLHFLAVILVVLRSSRLYRKARSQLWYQPRTTTRVALTKQLAATF